MSMGMESDQDAASFLRAALLYFQLVPLLLL